MAKQRFFVLGALKVDKVMKELVQCIENIKVTVNAINESTFEKYYKILLDCSDLPILGPGDETQCYKKLSNFFKSLKAPKQPAIYWFVVTSNHTPKQIISKIKKAHGNVKRTFPSLSPKRTSQYEPKVLYVGKTGSDLKNRIVSHLGYHKKSDNHGLQLCHWAGDLEMKLELNYVLLPVELESLTELFERELSKQLKPIIGKQVKDTRQSKYNLSDPRQQKSL